MKSMKWKCEESDNSVEIYSDSEATVELIASSGIDDSGISITLNKEDVYEIIEFLKQIYHNMD